MDPLTLISSLPPEAIIPVLIIATMYYLIKRTANIVDKLVDRDDDRDEDSTPPTAIG